MPENFIMPDAQSVQSLLQMIVGDGLSVSATDATILATSYVATYVDDDDSLVAACTADLRFVAFSGAALSLVPASVANEAIQEGKASDVMLDNFHEVMNICSKMLMSESSEHLRLDKTLQPGQSAEPLAILQGNSCHVSAFSVDVPGYGSGTLGFLIGG